MPVLDDIAKLLRCGLLSRAGYPGLCESDFEAAIDERRSLFRGLLARAPDRPAPPRVVEVGARGAAIPTGPRSSNNAKVTTTDDDGVDSVDSGDDDDEILHVRKRANVALVPRARTTAMNPLQLVQSELAVVKWRENNDAVFGDQRRAEQAKARAEQTKAEAETAKAEAEKAKAQDDALTQSAAAAIARNSARDDYIKRILTEFNAACKDNVAAARGSAHAALLLAYADVIVDPKARVQHIRRMLVVPKTRPAAAPTPAKKVGGVRVGAYVMGSLENRCRYVGGSADIDTRVKRHIDGSGTGWTAVHSLKIELPTLTPRMENHFAWEEEEYYANVADYGVDYVRGGPYPAMQLTPETRASVIVSCVTRLNLCYHCGRRGHFANICRATTYGPILDGMLLTGPIKPK